MQTFFSKVFFKSILTDFFDKPKGLSNRVDLRRWASPVEDQYELGSCTANAVANAYELLVNMHSPAEFVDLSRLFIYYNSRKLEGNINEDAGAFLYDTLKVVSKFGVCAESLWPYDIRNFNIKPNDECYTDAKQRRIQSYTEVQSISDMIHALDKSQPVVFGLPVSSNFSDLTWHDPVLKMPGPNDEVGGHAMCMVGYDKKLKLFLAKNSFGTAWGEHGYCWIPFDYIEAEGYDMWTFTLSKYL